MKKPIYTGTAKGWLTADGKRLVPTGSPLATILFATRGRKIRPSDVVGISNASEYFDIPKPEIPKPAPEPKREKK